MSEEKKILTFELDPQQVKYRDILNKEFLELEMWIISDANPNRNRTHFTLESMQDKDTQEDMHNKPILGFFEKGDFESHKGKAELDLELQKEFWNTDNGERILGLIRESDPIEIVEEGDLHWVKIKCALWINYCYKQVKRLLKDKNKKVSVEVTVLDSEIREDGIEDIKKFVLNGVTILGSRNGKAVLEGIPGAHLTVVDLVDTEAYQEQRSVLTFAYEQADANINKFGEKEECTEDSNVSEYQEADGTSANKTNSEERYSEEGETIKVDKSRDAMSNRAWGSINKTALRNRVAAARNFKTIAKSVFLDLREGWEDGETSKLKYPVMCIEDGTAVYNRGALTAAMSYAEKNNEQKIISKLKKIYKLLDLDKEKDFESNDDIVSENDTELLYTDEYSVNNLMNETEKEKVEQEAAEEPVAEQCAAEEEPKTEQCSEGCDSSETQGDAAEEPKTECEATTCEAGSEGDCDEGHDECCENDHDGDDDGEEKCPDCGEPISKCKCSAKCEAEGEEKPDEDKVCEAQELESYKARCAGLEQECEALQCSCDELKAKCEKFEAEAAEMAAKIETYADYADIKDRMVKAEAKLFEIKCAEMKTFAVSKMVNEKISDADRDAITKKAGEGKYESETELINEIAIAIYNARPAQQDRFSAEFPVVEENKPTKKNMTPAERLAAYTK